MVVSALDEVAWLLNLRGSDVECNPVFISYALVHVDKGVTLFVDLPKIQNVRERLSKQNITLLPYEGVVDQVRSVVTSLAPGEKVWIPKSCPYAIASLVPKVKYVNKKNKKNQLINEY